MTQSGETHRPAPAAFLATRRARLAKRLQTRLSPRPASGLPPEHRRFLREEAEELYWNELAWEKLTADEGVARGGLVERIFPGLLAFVDGLLVREAPPDGRAPATPRPEVVEDLLFFLAARCLELDECGDAPTRCERAITLRLIDLVLYRLHGLPVETPERLEPAAADGDD